MTREALRDVVAQELKALEGGAPEELLGAANFRLTRKNEAAATETELVDLLTEADINSAAKTQFRIRLSGWDATDTETWTTRDGTVTRPNSEERRHLIYAMLGIAPENRQRLDTEYPRDFSGATVISPELPWEPWYTAERQRERSFYWDAYRRVLLDKGLSGDSVSRLDGAATEVVKRIADPSRDNPYQSKGLVVGHVQSGKTANFTGVIAKAIDAGYRLVIVLTGTVEILRRQTQRRLDMELIGRENILGGIDPENEAAMSDVDYYRDGDQDWFDGKFLVHGVDPVDQDNIPSIRRLTSPSWDYKRLRAGLGNLDFRQGNELVNKNKALHDPVNLFRSDVRLAVVKKNKSTLEKLVTDLGNIHARLGEIPALIIDDEADQASVNTVKPRKNGQPSPEDRERSAINKLIAALMNRLTRCQYVGYTATPFANVFIDPDDAEDVFPKDFIISLDSPPGYMGGADFHDLGYGDGESERTPANSNEKAFVRGLTATTEDDERKERQHALDAFVLSGAIRLYRNDAGAGSTAKHHTMLVHETVMVQEHRELAGQLRTMWAQSGFSTPAGLARLGKLWREDYLPVCDARANGAPVPSSFDELRPYIGRAVDRISEGTTPVLIVNGDKDKDYEQQALDFQSGDVWKILVGGAKLSRGFTLEGLTVSYYKRRAGQADTLMQAGRWFGFRPGYRDLVRLYIGRNVAGPRKADIDLYDAFGTVVQDEEEFREQLRQYSELDEEGRPTVTPEDVPPMVFQQLPWLKPTQSNKMYNAELTRQGIGAKVQDFSLQPDRGNGKANRNNFAAALPLLSTLTEFGEFTYYDESNRRMRTWNAHYGKLDTDTLIKSLGKFLWTPNWSFEPHLRFVREAWERGTLEDWVVVLPQLGNPVTRYVGDYGEELPIIKRKRRERGGFSGSSFRQRDALEHIADGKDRRGGALAEELCTGTRGALLLNFAADNGDLDVRPSELSSPRVDPGDVATLFSWALPRTSAPKGRIAFKARKSGAGAIIDRQGSQ